MVHHWYQYTLLNLHMREIAFCIFLQYYASTTHFRHLAYNIAMLTSVHTICFESWGYLEQLSNVL